MQLDDGGNKVIKDYRYKILIVDDEPDAAITYKLVLEQNSQFSVNAFTDPQVALHSFSAGMYDLLLVNVKMPKMDGFQLCKKIREIDNRVKICFVTAQVNCEMVLKSYYRYLSISRVIQKPIENQELLKAVTYELENNKNNSANYIEIQGKLKDKSFNNAEFT
jgi:DNA-binding response OmpR family regulator